MSSALIDRERTEDLRICEFCGLVIEVDGQDCIALDDGRCAA